jgi:adenine-specific DNA-methyltransferase
MADTSLFDNNFKYALLATIDDLDANIDGLLIHGDNFQALKLLSKKYKRRIGCVYIDPPYNAPNSEIAYKNNFKHSSFLSLIENRLSISKELVNNFGSHIVAIDKNEKNSVERLIDDLFPEQDNVSITIEHNRKGVQDKHFSFTNEFAIFSIPQDKKDLNQVLRTQDDIEWSNFRNWGGESLRTDAANCFYAVFIKDDKIIGFGDVWADEDKHPKGANIEKQDGVIEIYPIDNDGVERKWRYERGTVEGIVDKLRIEKVKNGNYQIKLAKISDQFKTVWYSPKYNAGDNGTQAAKQMGLPIGKFDYPKSLFNTKDCIFAVTSNDDWILDYFAGSGTTGQSTIMLNREVVGSKRRYILVEQGEYFDTLIKPRIQKSIYSPDWRNGKPSSIELGVSHVFKILKLESYEDTLNNLNFKRSEAQQDLLNQLPTQVKNEYLIAYMLESESRDSFLNLEYFNKPFDCKLKVAVDSAGASEEKNIDLIETFNYLIGLNVIHVDSQMTQGFISITGVLPSGEKALILWRDVEKLDYEALNKICTKLNINPADNEFDVVYINGDHNIPSVFTTTDNEGGITKTLKIRQIEPEFLNQMLLTDSN